MEFRYMRRSAALLLAAFLLGTPAASGRADNTVSLEAPFRADDTAAIGAAAVADNTTGDSPSPPTIQAEQPPPFPGEDEGPREPSFGEEAPPPPAVADPIEPVNRAIFVFNDKAYRWVLKPVAKGYGYVVPEGVRVSVRDFFSNLATPVRVANNLLQGDLRATGTELLRFAINSTMGILGLFDTARDGFHIDRKEADLGQTLGRYGLGQGMYIVLPILGPSTLRDGAGFVGDGFLDPISYIRPQEASIGLKVYKAENGLSLRIGVYEDLTDAAVDPYIAVRDAYLQHRAAVVGKPASRN